MWLLVSTKNVVEFDSRRMIAGDEDCKCVSKQDNTMIGGMEFETAKSKVIDFSEYFLGKF